MNSAQGQMPQQGTGQAQGQPGPAGQQPRLPPMYQPNQIRNLPMLSEEEKSKYEQGLRGLWSKANNSPANSPDQLAARQKIIEFSKMLISKIQQRRSQAQQQAQQQAQPQPQPQPPQQQQAQQRPAQQQQQQQQQQQLLQGQQQAGQTLVRPPSSLQNPGAQAAVQAQAQQQQKQQQAAPGNANAGQGENGTPGTAAGQAQNPQTMATAAAATQRPKIPDHILQHASKMTFRTPMQLADKPPADVAKWIEEMRDRYARALCTMESSKSKVAGMEKVYKERSQAGKPLKDEELRQYHLRRDQQLKFYSEAHKWVQGVRKQQEGLQGNVQNGGAGPAATTGVQHADATQATTTSDAQNKAQATAQGNVAASANAAAVEAAKNQQQMSAANRASPATATPGPPQAPVRPATGAVQPALQQPQGQPQAHKSEQASPAPVNTSGLSSATVQTHAQPASTPAQGAARVQAPQSSAAATTTAGGPTRALSHSAAMSLANQRATGTPGSASIQGQPPGVGTPSGAGLVHSSPMQQQGHPHAHPTQQQQAGMTSKMPIPKQLPENATTVPQGVTVGGGVTAGRPTMSQGSGTLGGVMNQPPITRIQAYNHDAEGDHVLSKKKLDELVRQVCGASAEGHDGNLLSPDVEENILNMADSFVDNVLHAACRNSKERGSKVLEIRDIQLVLERTYNIRVPGYSSDELRTVRKVQPSAGWIAKMSAVQAAKVMPGKGEL